MWTICPHERGRSISRSKKFQFATRDANISGYIRDNQGLTIFERDLADIAEHAPPSVAEKAIKALLAIAEERPEPGTEFHPHYAGVGELLQLKAMLHDGICSFERCANHVMALKLMGTCWAESDQEMIFLIEDYLGGRGYLRTGIENGKVITPAGWAFIEELRRGDIRTDKAFVAMSFRKEIATLFDEGIALGVSRAGYRAIRIDRLEHNNKIDDEIIAAIRSCKFLIADFTVDRGGIYFEAGLAMGLGRQVIWTVREDKLHEVHFDNRQYNFLRWSPSELQAFATALHNRIEATIGKGPYVHS